MSLGIDYSFGRPNLDEVAKKYKFVIRYLSSDPNKAIDLAEAQNIRHHKLDLVLVWEDTANAALNGKAQGAKDATEALKQANAIGWPSNLPIYFAVDFDATPEQQGAINEYMQGVCDVIGLDRAGIYGGFYVIERVAEAHVAHWFFQTCAWSGGQISKHAQIYQNGNSDFNAQADIDEALTNDFGQWTEAPAPKPTPKPKPVPAAPVTQPQPVPPVPQKSTPTPAKTPPSKDIASTSLPLSKTTSTNSSWWVQVWNWLKGLL